MSHAFWPHNGEQGCTWGNNQSWMSVYRKIAISTINRRVDSALMQRQDTCLRQWQWLVSKKPSFDVMNKFNRHSLCRTFQILNGFLQFEKTFLNRQTCWTFFQPSPSFWLKTLHLHHPDPISSNFSSVLEGALFRLQRTHDRRLSLPHLQALAQCDLPRLEWPRSWSVTNYVTPWALL